MYIPPMISSTNLFVHFKLTDVIHPSDSITWKFYDAELKELTGFMTYKTGKFVSRQKFPRMPESWTAILSWALSMRKTASKH